VMKTYNSYATDEPLADLSAAIKRFDTGRIGENDSINISLTAFNYTNKQGLTVEEGSSFYLSQYALKSTYQYDIMQMDYMHQFVDLLSRAVKTDSPDGLFIRLDWYYYDASVTNNSNAWQHPSVFLSFSSASDEQEFLTLMDAWDAAQRTT
jgi:hypothetical protein